MAALAADIAAIFDPRYEIGLMQEPCVGADTFYRGGLAHRVLASGLLTLTPAAVDNYAGVVMEHKVTTAASELVWVAASGRWYFQCAQFILADLEKTFATAAATLFDNPADLVINAVGTAGAVGVLYKVETTATSGWLDTDRRVAPTNT